MLIMKKNNLIQKIFIVILSFFVMIIFALTLRGLPGNPSIEDLKTARWKFDGPLELSPERGRFALVYSIVENKSLYFSPELARMTVPDLAISELGNYVSLFAPGVSFLVLPGYYIGKLLGAAQVGTYALIAFFAFLNFLLILNIAIKFGASRWASFIGALTFSFATPAFAYGVNLYQHHISVFLLLFSLYMIVKYNNYFSLSLVWLACVASVVIDNPNFFLMFPIGLYALFQLGKKIKFAHGEGKIAGAILKSLVTFVAIVPPLMFFLWYNEAAYGDPLQLPGTLPSVTLIDENNKPLDESFDEKGVKQENQSTKEKTAVGFFQTRNLYNGFYEHFVSKDRGMIYFTPVILLGILGLIFLYRHNSNIASLFIAVVGVNILLYSMWGDPYGGWAFGSRYLIPSYAILSIGIALIFSQYYRKWIFLIVFVALFAYSAWVNTLGAITTSTIPTKGEVLLLEEKTGHEEKYTFMRSWEFLNKKYSDIGSKSFAYQVFFKKYLEAREYFFAVYGMILMILILGGIGLFRENYNKRINKNYEN